MISKTIFGIATATLAYGVFQNLRLDGAVGGNGTMAMNSYYLLAIAGFAASAAARIVFEAPSK